MTDKLNEYKEKRDFQKTSEPKGKTKESKDALRFVVQHHMARAEHYDFRLEWEGVLLSWAVPKGPSYDTHDKRLAVKVEDHPLDYRNFEGTIPKGEYGGGTVMLWDEGFWEPVGDVDSGLKKGEIKFILSGKRLKGKWTLIKWKAKSTKDKDNWLLIKEKDEYASDEKNILKLDTSIRSSRTMVEIEGGKEAKVSKNPFNKVKVQLATLVDKMPKEKDWIYEVKYDGFRIIAFVEEDEARLMTRNENDYKKQFARISSTLVDFALGRSMVLDGEVVVLNESGKTDFQGLQNYLKHNNNKDLTYIVFDILALDGEDLRDKPLKERKEILKNLMEDAPPELHFSNYIKGEEDIFKAACDSGLEGIICKKLNSIYSGSRDDSWLKLKCENRQEFVIGGYTLTDKRASGVSALLLGLYKDDEFIYVGRAGTGLSESDMEMLEKRFKSLKRVKSYFKQVPKERSNEEITWLKPELVADIKFAQWTNDNLLRQASFKGIRTDKIPEEVIKEEEIKIQPKKHEKVKNNINNEVKSIGEEIKITHPDKVLFQNPKITKGEVVDYYKQVAERMIPYVSNRILSSLRCPKGIDEDCFFMKHPLGKSKYISSVKIKESSGDKDDYFYIKDEAGIVYEAQMGTIEFHTWASNIDELEKPDVMVFDLDPDKGMDISKIREGVKDIKGILDELGLKSFLKTSGGKGYHVVVPVKPNIEWEDFKSFANTVAEVMEKKWPEKYTTNIRKVNRKNRIFIDWLRNGRGATSVAPYSIRARKGAKVSMPIFWEELDEIAPDGIDMEEAIKRAKGEDPWEEFFSQDQMLK